jgi:hypothetical protein
MLDRILSSLLLWYSIAALPLVMNLYNPLSKAYTYEYYFPNVPNEPTSSWPSPIGLSLGILAVIIGHIFVLIYFTLRTSLFKNQLTSIQKEGPPQYDLMKEMMTHLSQHGCLK